MDPDHTGDSSDIVDMHFSRCGNARLRQNSYAGLNQPQSRRTRKAETDSHTTALSRSQRHWYRQAGKASIRYFPHGSSH